MAGPLKRRPKRKSKKKKKKQPEEEAMWKIKVEGSNHRGDIISISHFVLTSIEFTNDGYDDSVRYKILGD